MCELSTQKNAPSKQPNKGIYGRYTPTTINRRNSLKIDDRPQFRP